MPKYIIILILSSAIEFFSTEIYADVPKALANAQAGLKVAQATELPTERKYIRVEKREEGVLLYKISIRRIDEETIRIKIIGYDGIDEVSILTHTIRKKKQ